MMKKKKLSELYFTVKDIVDHNPTFTLHKTKLRHTYKKYCSEKSTKNQKLRAKKKLMITICHKTAKFKILELK